MNKLIPVITMTAISSFGSMIVYSTSSEVEVITATLWSEARGQSDDELLAIASVIHWRKEKSWNNSKTYNDICCNGEFSGWKSNSIIINITNDIDLQAYYTCKSVAESIINGDFVRSIEASHFHSIKVTPYWAKKFKFIRQIGKTKFYMS